MASVWFVEPDPLLLWGGGEPESFPGGLAGVEPLLVGGFDGLPETFGAAFLRLVPLCCGVGLGFDAAP